MKNGGIIIKRIIFITFILTLLFLTIINVNASETVKVKVNNKYFDTLEDAINYASSKDTINLTNNISLENTIEINKTVNINLNNFNIENNEKVFLIKGGSLNLSGTGTIKEKNPYYGAIMLIGSDDKVKEDFSTVSIGENITLEGWSGIFINQNNNTAYGIRVNLKGKIKAVDDSSGNTGIGIYVNGKINNQENSPIINIGNTANIQSTGVGIYAAGYAEYYINGAHIEGVESGLGIKSGYFNILDGTILGTGVDKTPTNSNNNGINPTGVAIQIESNPGYSGNIELNIKNGLIQSNNSNVIYEYTINNGPSQVNEINISGGQFISKKNKTVFLLSQNLTSNLNKFISGGKFSSDPSEYLKSGFKVKLSNDSMYEVISNNTDVFKYSNENKNNNSVMYISIVSLVIIATTLYLNRSKIKYIIKKIFS